MTWNEVVNSAVSKWSAGDGPHSDVALSSRIRVARNLDGFPFPNAMNETQAKRVVDSVAPGLREVNLVGVCPKVDLFRLWEAPVAERQVLVEKHLISPALAQDARGKAVAISSDEMVSVMVNEEDHLRTQVLVSGFQPGAAWQVASKVDDALESKLHFAFHPEFGYLTACPTNVGTGLRASVMLHLPALVMTDQAARVFSTLGQVGLAIRGYFGEGTDALGHLYQISNQVTLGRSEEDIVANLEGVVQHIIEHERRAREHLLRERRAHLEDRIGRSYGVLCHARILSSEEAMRLISDVRLGVALQLMPGVTQQMLNRTMVATRPVFLQRLAGREVTASERDILRATLIRETLARPDRGESPPR